MWLELIFRPSIWVPWQLWMLEDKSCRGHVFTCGHLPYQPSSCTLPDTAIPGETKREQKVHKLGKPLALESPKEDPCSPWPSGLFSEDRGGGWGPGLWSLSRLTGRGSI